MYAFHFLLGVCTALINNFTSFLIQKQFLVPIDYTKQDQLIIGTWKVSGQKDYKSAGHKDLCTLYKIPYELKCTQTNIYFYAYTLGRFITSRYYWLHVHDETFHDIVYTPSYLYEEW